MILTRSEKITLSPANRKKYALVIYDISKTKRRNRFVKIMNSFGQRVQKSAFEFLLSESKLQELKNRIENFYSEEEHDEIRIYHFRGETDLTIYGEKEMIFENELGLEFI